MIVSLLESEDFFMKGNFFKKYGWIFPSVAGFLAVLFAVFPVLTLNDHTFMGWDVLFGINGFSFGIASVLSLIAVLIGILSGILMIFYKKHKSISSIVLSLLLVSGFMILFVDQLAITQSDVFYDSYRTFYVVIIATTQFVGAILALSVGYEQDNYSIYQIAEAGMLVAMAIVLDIIPLKIKFDDAGGSIKLAMLPLYLLALRQGPLKGFIGGGVVFGLITCLTDGYGLLFYPTDYLISFGSVLFLGLFRNQILSKDQTSYNIKGILFLSLGIVISIIVRQFACTVSGVYFLDLSFELSFYKNLLYVPISGLLCLVALIALYNPIIRINKMLSNKRNLQ